MNNMPEMKVGIVAVSRDCFPESLSVTRRENLVNAYTQKYGKDDIYECPICIVESEVHMQQALEDIKKAGCNALCVYLGNFGPEISETMLAKYFEGPKMFVAAAEETSADGGLVQGRGDAYCGMLNASYNLKLRNVGAYIPEYPVGTAEECADMIHEFLPVARAVYGLNHLKIITFGPRPTNFLACNAPIKQLYNLGVEIEENSELDLFESFHKPAVKIRCFIGKHPQCCTATRKQHKKDTGYNTNDVQTPSTGQFAFFLRIDLRCSRLSRRSGCIIHIDICTGFRLKRIRKRKCQQQHHPGTKPDIRCLNNCGECIQHRYQYQQHFFCPDIFYFFKQDMQYGKQNGNRQYM